jgi:hypothetical protein
VLRSARRSLAEQRERCRNRCSGSKAGELASFGASADPPGAWDEVKPVLLDTMGVGILFLFATRRKLLNHATALASVAAVAVPTALGLAGASAGAGRFMSGGSNVARGVGSIVAAASPIAVGHHRFGAISAGSILRVNTIRARCRRSM